MAAAFGGACSSSSPSHLHHQHQPFQAQCRHRCSHQQLQQQKQQHQHHHNVKWKPQVPNRDLKPKLPAPHPPSSSFPHLPNIGNEKAAGFTFGTSNPFQSNLLPTIPTSHKNSAQGHHYNHLQGRHNNHATSSNPMVAKVSALPRKWCDFVFRRNADNNLYKSDSFRFIQKTSSLEPLIPKNAYIRNRLRKATVPVSDDYVEPLDQLILPSVPQSRTESKSDSRYNTGFGTDPEEPSYHEIPEKYNAPYYYSDTLKGSEETAQDHITEDRSSGDNSAGFDSNGLSPSITFILYNHHESCPLSKISPVNTNSSALREKSRSCHCFFSSAPEEAETVVAMARKRYETAFLASNFPPSQSPLDLDSMLRGIESNSSTRDNNTGELLLMKNSTGGNEGSTHQESNSASSKYNAVTGVTIIHCHAHSSHNSPSRSRTASASNSPSSKIAALSEPLPQKKYVSYLSTGSSSTQSSSSTGCSTTMSSSPSHSSSRASTGRASTGGRIFDSHNRNNMAALLKDNSISSLESIDSLGSEDLKSATKNGAAGPSGQQRLGLKTTKLLSPISDKSPMEPPNLPAPNVAPPNPALLNLNLDSLDIQDHTYNDCVTEGWSRENIKSAVELTNVPWEMPKLRRKLALLADSGISLDFPKPDEEPIIPHHAFKFCKVKKKIEQQDLTNESNQETRAAVEGASHIADNFGLGGGAAGVSDIEPQPSYAESEREEYYESTEMTVEPLLAAPQAGPSFKRPRPDKAKMRLNFGATEEIDPNIELDAQEWFHGAITRIEAELILRSTKEGSFLVRNCESSTYCRYSLSIKSTRGCIHLRIEPNSLGTYSLADQEFETVSHMVLHFMTHRLPIKGAEHVKLKYPVITQLL